MRFPRAFISSRSEGSTEAKGGSDVDWAGALSVVWLGRWRREVGRGGKANWRGRVERGGKQGRVG